jgi:hypothetical protein
MKKVFLALVFCLVSFTAYAQENEALRCSDEISEELEKLSEKDEAIFLNKCGKKPPSKAIMKSFAKKVFRVYAHDPSSVQIVACALYEDSLPDFDIGTCWSYVCSIRAKNAFGALVLSEHDFEYPVIHNRISKVSKNQIKKLEKKYGKDKVAPCLVFH